MKHTTTGLSAKVANNSAVRDGSTRLGVTKKEFPKKVRWLQRHWVSKCVVLAPTLKDNSLYFHYCLSNASLYV